MARWVGIRWVLGILLLGGLVVIGLKPESKEGDGLPLLFPDFQKHINTVDQIVMVQSGKTITLKRKEGAWFVSGYDGMPAQFSAVRRPLMALAETKIVEEKTKDPKHYASLEVTGGKEKNGKGQNMTFYAGKTPLLSLIMGKEEPLLSGASHPDFYIRLQDTVYWTRGALPFPSEAKAYLDPVLWTLGASRLKTVSWQTRDRQGEARRPTPFDPIWQDAKGGSLAEADNVLVQSILRQWSDTLPFSDMRPAEAFDGQPSVFTVTLGTFDGFSVTLKGHQDSEKKSVWVLIETQAEEAKAPSFWENQKPKTFTGSLDLQPKDVVVSDIAELQAKVKGRAFQISPYPATFLLPKTETSDPSTSKIKKTNKKNNQGAL